MQEVIMIVGLPASGKSTLVKKYPNFKHLNRDTTGGDLKSLLVPMKNALKAGESVVLDNLNATVETRKPFLDVAKECGVPVICEWMDTSPEDCQINVLIRMWKKYGKVFYHPDEINSNPQAKNDPSVFPATVIFHYKKIFEKPTVAEGFASINKVAFEREWGHHGDFRNKAVFLDYDGTLRDVIGGKYKFPTTPEEIKIINGASEAVEACRKNGLMVFGISNQSGIARKQVTDKQVRECFEATNKMLKQEIEVAYCPHNVPPVCYCRKPQVGLAIPFIMEHKIDVTRSFMVGDQTTDRTFSTRLGMKYMDHKDFFSH